MDSIREVGQQYSSHTNTDYKTIYDYTLDDHRALMSTFPELVDKLGDEYSKLASKEKTAIKENEVMSKKI